MKHAWLGVGVVLSIYLGTRRKKERELFVRIAHASSGVFLNVIRFQRFVLLLLWPEPVLYSPRNTNNHISSLTIP